MEIPRQTVNAPGGKIAVLDITCPTDLAQISRLLFDFGWNAAETVIKLSNISICGKENESSVNNVLKDKILINQTKHNINIISEREIQSIIMYTETGVKVPINLQGNNINISNFSSGIYLLKVMDMDNNNITYKVIIK